MNLPFIWCTFSKGRFLPIYRSHHYETFALVNELSTIAIGMVIGQIIFAVNFSQHFLQCCRNLWRCNSIEWLCLSPVGHGNFDGNLLCIAAPNMVFRSWYWPLSLTQPPPDGVSRQRRFINCLGITTKGGQCLCMSIGLISRSAKIPWVHGQNGLLGYSCLTFPLIFVGGLIMTTDAGMAVLIGQLPMVTTCFCILV